MVLVSCGGESVSQNPAPLAGLASKGLYQPGSTVEVFDLETGVSVASGEVSDSLGHYSVTIPESVKGPFEVVVTGYYIDELTGIPSNSAQSTSLIVTEADRIRSLAHINPITTVQTELVKLRLANQPGLTSEQLEQEIKSDGLLVMQAFRISTRDQHGDDVEPSDLNLVNPIDSRHGADLLIASAVVTELINNGSVTSLKEFAKNVAQDINNGDPIGTTSNDPSVDLVAAINDAIKTVKNQTATLLKNLEDELSKEGEHSDISQIDLDDEGQDLDDFPPTASTGFALKDNTFTVGSLNPVIGTVDATGKVALANPVNKDDVVFKFTLLDFNSNKQQTINSSMGFKITDKYDRNRYLEGVISPIRVDTFGTGKVELSVPAGAIFSYNGSTPAKTHISGVLTNLTANTILTTDTSGETSLDANSLATLVQNKANVVGQTMLDFFGVATTLHCEIAISVNLGLANASNTGIQSFLPLSETRDVHGRHIFGDITLN